MPDEGESCEELLNLLHQRLVATGEWTVLLGQLRNMLEEDGWDVRLREHAEKEAKAQEPLNLASLVAKLDPYAQSTLPESVRAAISEKLREFLDRNLEDA
ncbi:SAGA histone acetylase and TREX-2 complexes component [Malassezia cuniculi]|uniref:Transcription and mRNA export factor SUS1 n=1 Tax=Malassezia cuniculi TaxID=948313 RepID=A0AAF0J4P2_9BASI|nr:SAGA histone acetylase and TREX-2 complexes component [Malassezia cuniculi]